MASMRINVGGHEYVVACDDGQEAHLRRLAQMLDSRLRAIGASGKAADPQFMLLAALMLADELEDTKNDVGQLREDIHHSSQSFEQNKQIELENILSGALISVAARIEAIAEAVEKAA